MKKEIKNNEESKELSKETKELIKKEYYREIEKSILLFLEHYNGMKKSVNYMKDDSASKETLEELEEEFEIKYLSRLMRKKVDDPEMKELITNYKKKYEAVALILQKTEKCINFFTNIFNCYIEKNISLKNTQHNNKNKRKYRSAILLKKHYMDGKELDEIGIYNEDVYCTSTSEYQKKFVMDRKVLINNLAPMIFGIDGIESIK